MPWDLGAILGGAGNIANIVELFKPGGFRMRLLDDGNTITIPRRRLYLTAALTILTIEFAAVGYFSDHKIPGSSLMIMTSKEWNSYPLTDVVHQKFSHETVELDGHHFLELRFRFCNISLQRSPIQNRRWNGKRAEQHSITKPEDR